MLFSKRSFSSLLLLPVTLRYTWAQNTTSSSSACNNSPKLCSTPYNQITHLGAHDSPFLRNSDTDFSASGNQFYNTTVQLSAGVRLLTAQVHQDNGELHLCHSECWLLDAGLFSDWLSEIRTWMESNPNEVVTILIVNSDGSSASNLAAQYEAAGITDLAYTPSGSIASTQTWPTLESLISSGQRLLNFVDSGVDDNSAAPYLMPEYSYIFENPYDVTKPNQFVCEANRPSQLIDKTGLGIQMPAVDNTTTTNAPNGGLGTLGCHATQCTQQYGRPPTFVLVDYFNVGPAIKTVDRLNGVSNPVGRMKVSPEILTASAGVRIEAKWIVRSCLLGVVLAYLL